MCGKPHDAVVPIATNRGWYGKYIKGFRDGKETSELYWHDKNGKPTPYMVGPRIYAKRTPEEVAAGLKHGKEIKLKVGTEHAWLTELKQNNISIWVCTDCRASILSKQKKATPQQEQDAFFDLKEIDAKGEAKKKSKDPLRFFTD